MKSYIGGTPVEWDENKNRLNIMNTGSAFRLPHWYLDRLHSQDEERYVVLGCVQGVLYVVNTMRDEYARLISARMATAYERKIYYGEE